MIKAGVKKLFSVNLSWAEHVALGYLLVLVSCALFADWLPLEFAPDNQDIDLISQPPVPWQSKETGRPFHWLGTDKLGRDVLANIVFGARTALVVSVPAMAMATVLGILLGSLAGYYGDSGYKKSLANILAAILALVFLPFYFFFVPDTFLTYNLLITPWQWKIIVLLVAVILYKLLVWLLQKITFFQKKYALPLDFLVLKTIELLQSVPRLLLVLFLASFATPGLMGLIGLSAFTYWPAIARLVRAEMLKLKELPFIETTKVLGFSDLRIITKHALPNALVPVIVAVAFGIGNLMVLESTLSFIGNGVSVSEPSWGRMINDIRQNAEAWWLLLFPGLALCFTVLSIQAVSQIIIRQINPE